ncbi:alpha/beta hydrolase (plasmid) [Rhodococcus opacus]|uniref:Alpha/beta hydrolase n=1 Tax=Rhodococcus opacus TaxID=37919 RepID=A0A1B1KH94_RHOOP|nr:alpha/beta hydrolase [Rhodococcus opacus]ANS31986.1 alpha/beta hydrolase [Rhodococcus opacus]
MPVDGQVQSLLDQMREADAKPFESMTVPEARLAGWDFIALQGPPEEVASVDHRFIPGLTADLPVRIYYPEGKGPFPALIYLHGGGWVIGNNEVGDAVSRSLANRTGCVFIQVNYQKAPERKFPAAVDDAWVATNWVFDNAADLGVDPARIGIIGDSAGGNLAAVTALRARDESGPHLKCQVLIYPVTDGDLDKGSYEDYAEGYLLQRESMRWFYSHYLNDLAEVDDPRVSPLRASRHSDLPPAIIVTAGYDPLRDDGRLYADKLRNAGIKVKHLDYPGAIHGFFWMQGVLDVSRELHDKLGMAIKAIMK